MKTFHIKIYFTTLAIFFVIDLVWLAAVANKFYTTQLGSLMSSNTNWLAAVLFYLLYILGVLVFVVLPGLEKGSLRQTILHGALFGLICYATYDLTNLATIRDWPWIITLVDLAWGTTLTALVGSLSYLAAKRMQK